MSGIDAFRAPLSAAIISYLESLDPSTMDDVGLLKSGALLRVLDSLEQARGEWNSRAHQFFILGSL